MSIEDQGQADTETSLRDDLAAALAQHMQADTGGDAGTASTTPAAQENAENGGQEDGQGTAPPARSDGRDDKGRFASKGEAAPTAPVDPAAPAAADGAAEGGVSKAPSSWRSDAANAWEQLPEAVRAEIHRRERDMAGMTGRQESERMFGKEMADVIRPFDETIRGFGVTPQFAIGVLLNNDRIMRTGTPEQKVELARRMIGEYGIDMQVLATPDPRMPQDPHVRALQQELHQLRQQVARPAQQEQQYAPLPVDSATATIGDDIEAFRADPAHPHFQQVMPQMALLIESGAAPGLKEAYLMAVAARPDLSSTQPAPAALVAQQTQDRTIAARRAAVSVSGSPGMVTAPRPATLRDELSEQLRLHGWT